MPRDWINRLYYAAKAAHAIGFGRRRAPQLEGEELQEAARNWVRYLLVVKRIHDRLVAEGRQHEIVDGIAELREQEAKRELVLALISVLREWKFHLFWTSDEHRS